MQGHRKFDASHSWEVTEGGCCKKTRNLEGRKTKEFTESKKQ